MLPEFPLVHAGHSVSPAFPLVHAGHSVSPSDHSVSPAFPLVHAGHSVSPSDHFVSPAFPLVHAGHSVSPSDHFVSPAFPLVHAGHSVSPSDHSVSPSDHFVSPSGNSVRPYLEYQNSHLKLQVFSTENGKDIHSITYTLGDISGEIPVKIIQLIPASLNRDILKDLVWLETKLPNLFPSLRLVAKKLDNISAIAQKMPLYSDKYDDKNDTEKFLYVFVVELAIYLISNHLATTGNILVPDYPTVSEMSGLLLTSESIFKMSLVFRIWCLSCDNLVSTLGVISLNFCTTFSQLFQSSDSTIPYSAENGIINACVAAVDKLNVIIHNHKTDMDREMKTLKDQISELTDKMTIIEGEFIKKVC